MENGKEDRIVKSLLEEVKRHLVETTTRNRLIHVNRQNKRARAINIINERSEDVFEILRKDGKRMDFKAMGKDDDEDQNDLLLSTGDDEKPDETRYRDLILETPLGPEALQRQLLRLFTNARTAEEEQGINILYLAMGFLTWFENKSSGIPREAPLILVPVELVRNKRGSSFNLRCRDDDIVTNLPLQERLSKDFGIQLPDIDDSAVWTPNKYFGDVGNAISKQERWQIDVDGMQLGFFSFAKLLMLRDLDPENWPDASLVRNELVQRLLKDSFQRDPPLFEDGEKLDARLDPKDIVHVVDADASQARVIEEVRSGRNLVVQGPPGTGKSQTITNIIAAAVHDGKSVLFMAEKMAALEVVYSRLKKIGLSNICLELHSRNASKKNVLEELDRTLRNKQAEPRQPSDPDELRKVRNKLNQVADYLHEDLPECDYNLFSIMGEISNFIGREVPPPKVKDLHKLSAEELDLRAQAIKRFVKSFNVADFMKNNPFWGAAFDLTPTDKDRLKKELGKALKAVMGEISNFIGREVPPPKVKDLHKLSAEERDLRVQAIKKFVKSFNVVDSMKDHPFLDANSDLTPTDEDRLKKELGKALKAVKSLIKCTDKVAEEFDHLANEKLAKIERFICSKRFKTLHAAKSSSFWAQFSSDYRSASRELSSLLERPLPFKLQARRVLIAQLFKIRRLRKTLARQKGFKHAEGELTDSRVLISVQKWVSSVLAVDSKILLEIILKFAGLQKKSNALRKDLYDRIQKKNTALQHVCHRSGLAVDAFKEPDLLILQERLESMDKTRYGEWVAFAHAAKVLDDMDLSFWREAVESGKLPASHAIDDFQYAVAEARWEHAFTLQQKQQSEKFDPYDDRHQRVQDFCELDRERISDMRALVRAKHSAQLPKGAEGDMGIIKGQIGRQSGHMPIRKIISLVGRTVRQIKPVFLMSPISIAQFLKPGAIEFDLLVIDEASQVRPADALGAVARAKQIVVVGDKKQLPPTRFFERLTGALDNDKDEEEDESITPGLAQAGDLESILTLCEARGVKSSMLEWHYRSRDPSLMRVSNEQFYENRLILHPSPLQMDDNYGLKFNRVPGIYSSKSKGDGRPGTNRIEAEHIADALALHARERPDTSIGVVAFSSTQRDMITEVLEERRRDDAKLASFLREGGKGNVFVKNIENVQGDERSVILISVGYGPYEANGRLPSMKFGPVNAEGGERRLNVLFSRAQERCEIFASFDPEEIDLTRTQGEGPRVLRRFLEFARTGKFDEKFTTGLAADSPFEEDVARVIEEFGFPVDPQVGSAGFRIDIGVRHPNRTSTYILAVECDGAAWHSSLWARDRDRLRQDILEGLGWRFHRIWSTDWFYRRDKEIERLRIALGKALEAAKVEVDEMTQTKEVAVEESNKDSPVPEITQPDQKVSVYCKAEVKAPRLVELQKLSQEEMVDMVVGIVGEEGPIHCEEVARRVASAFEKQRIGKKIQDAVNGGLQVARRKKRVISDRNFWFTVEQEENPPVRDRSAEILPTVRAEYLSPLEIRAAERIILAKGEKSEDEIIRAVSRLLGFKRVGKDLAHVIANALQSKEMKNS